MRQAVPISSIQGDGGLKPTSRRLEIPAARVQRSQESFVPSEIKRHKTGLLNKPHPWKCPAPLLLFSFPPDSNLLFRGTVIDFIITRSCLLHNDRCDDPMAAAPNFLATRHGLLHFHLLLTRSTFYSHFIVFVFPCECRVFPHVPELDSPFV